MKSEKKLLGVIKEELEAIAAEYGDDRRTVLEAPDNAQAQLTEEPPAAEEAVVAFTYGGQLKRMSPQLYRKTPLETAEDAAERPRFLFQTDTEETLLFFTNLGNCYSLRVDALPEIKPKDRGNLLTGVLAGLESGEAPLWITCCRPARLAKEPDLLFVTRRGMVKRTAAADYDVRGQEIRRREPESRGQPAHRASRLYPGDLLMFTRAGMCIRFGLDTVPVQGRISAGVRGMQVDEEDELIWCGQVGENDEMILFSERGYGKRILSCDFEKQNRNGQGREILLLQQERLQREIPGRAVPGRERPLPADHPSGPKPRHGPEQGRDPPAIQDGPGRPLRNGGAGGRGHRAHRPGRKLILASGRPAWYHVLDGSAVKRSVA